MYVDEFFLSEFDMPCFLLYQTQQFFVYK